MNYRRRLTTQLASWELVMMLSATVSRAESPMPQPSVSQQPKAKLVPAILIKKDKLSVGDDPHLPDAVKALYRCDVVTGSYKVCIGQDGHIASVDALDGIHGADNDIVATVQRWRYKPQPVMICFMQYFEFRIDGGGEDCNRPEWVI